MLLLTPLSFAEAGIVTGALTVLLVPYLCIVLVELHADLMAARGEDPEATTVPSTTIAAPA